jgi:hypothetical protein
MFDVVLPGNLLLVDLESRTNGENTKNESAYNVCQILVQEFGKRPVNGPQWIFRCGT